MTAQIESAMEISNTALDQENNQSEANTREQIVIEHLNHSLRGLFRTVKDRIHMNKFSVLLDLRAFSDQNSLTKLKSEAILIKLLTAVRSILKTRHSIDQSLLVRCLHRWSEQSTIQAKLKARLESYEQQELKALADAQSKLSDTLREKDKIAQSELQAASKEKALKESLEQKHGQIASRVEKTREKIAAVEAEIGSLKATIKRSSENSNENIEARKSLERKIAECSGELSRIKEENREKDYSINKFLNEMNEMIAAHEKHIELLVNAKSGYRLNTQGVGKKPGSKGSSYKYLNTGGNSNARPSISRTRVGSKQKPIMNTYKLNDYIVFAKGKIK